MALYVIQRRFHRLTLSLIDRYFIYRSSIDIIAPHYSDLEKGFYMLNNKVIYKGLVRLASQTQNYQAKLSYLKLASSLKTAAIFLPKKKVVDDSSTMSIDDLNKLGSAKFVAGVLAKLFQPDLSHQATSASISALQSVISTILPDVDAKDYINQSHGLFSRKVKDAILKNPANTALSTSEIKALKDGRGSSDLIDLLKTEISGVTLIHATKGLGRVTANAMEELKKTLIKEGVLQVSSTGAVIPVKTSLSKAEQEKIADIVKTRAANYIESTSGDKEVKDEIANDIEDYLANKKSELGGYDVSLDTLAASGDEKAKDLLNKQIQLLGSRSGSGVAAVVIDQTMKYEFFKNTFLLSDKWSASKRNALVKEGLAKILLNEGKVASKFKTALKATLSHWKFTPLHEEIIKGGKATEVPVSWANLKAGEVVDHIQDVISAELMTFVDTLNTTYIKPMFDNPEDFNLTVHDQQYIKQTWLDIDSKLDAYTTNLKLAGSPSTSWEEYLLNDCGLRNIQNGATYFNNFRDEVTVAFINSLVAELNGAWHASDSRELRRKGMFEGNLGGGVSIDQNTNDEGKTNEGLLAKMNEVLGDDELSQILLTEGKSLDDLTFKSLFDQLVYQKSFSEQLKTMTGELERSILSPGKGSQEVFGNDVSVFHLMVSLLGSNVNTAKNLFSLFEGGHIVNSSQKKTNTAFFIFLLKAFEDVEYYANQNANSTPTLFKLDTLASLVDLITHTHIAQFDPATGMVVAGSTGLHIGSKNGFAGDLAALAKKAPVKDPKESQADFQARLDQWTNVIYPLEEKAIKNKFNSEVAHLEKAKQHNLAVLNNMAHFGKTVGADAIGITTSTQGFTSILTDKNQIIDKTSDALSAFGGVAKSILQCAAAVQNALLSWSDLTPNATALQKSAAAYHDYLVTEIQKLEDELKAQKEAYHTLVEDLEEEEISRMVGDDKLGQIFDESNTYSGQWFKNLEAERKKNIHSSMQTIEKAIIDLNKKLVIMVNQLNDSFAQQLASFHKIDGLFGGKDGVFNINTYMENLHKSHVLLQKLSTQQFQNLLDLVRTNAFKGVFNQSKDVVKISTDFVTFIKENDANAKHMKQFMTEELIELQDYEKQVEAKFDALLKKQKGLVKDVQTTLKSMGKKGSLNKTAGFAQVKVASTSLLSLQARIYKLASLMYSK